MFSRLCLLPLLVCGQSLEGLEKYKRAEIDVKTNEFLSGESASTVSMKRGGDLLTKYFENIPKGEFEDWQKDKIVVNYLSLPEFDDFQTNRTFVKMSVSPNKLSFISQNDFLMQKALGTRNVGGVWLPYLISANKTLQNEVFIFPRKCRLLAIVSKKQSNSATKYYVIINNRYETTPLQAADDARLTLSQLGFSYVHFLVDVTPTDSNSCFAAFDNQGQEFETYGPSSYCGDTLRRLLCFYFSDSKQSKEETNNRIDAIRQDRQGGKAKVEAGTHNSTLLPNIEVKSGGLEIELNGIRYTVFIQDKVKHKIEFHWVDPRNGRPFRTFQSLNDYYINTGVKPLMFMNAGMYKTDHTPQGLFISKENGEMFPIDKSREEGKGNFYMQPNGVFYIDKKNTGHVVKTDAIIEMGETKKGNNIQLATQSGPMLVIDGKINSKFTKGSRNVYVRNGVGIMGDGRIVFAISNTPCNFYDFSLLFSSVLGCTNALYLDGAISKMYIDNQGLPIPSGEFGPMISVIQR